MKVLLDEMLTARLAKLLIGHEVRHVTQLDWRNVTNGKLLSLAEESGFEALITKDTNIPYQQNLTGRQISVIVVSPRIKLGRLSWLWRPAS